MEFELYVVRVFVSDWERALSFYTETLGIALSSRADDIGWAQLDTGAAQLALERLSAEDPEASELLGRFVGVSLRVDDVQATYDALVERRVDFLGPPQAQSWGGVLAHFRDPDQNVLTLLGR